MSLHSTIRSTSLAVVLIAAIAPQAYAGAKTPGATYCHRGVCHRILTLDETAQQVGRRQTKTASHYNAPHLDRQNPSIVTSSGETFQPGQANNVASPIYPDGTIVLLWSAASRVAVVARVNNRGPYHLDWKLDVSQGIAHGMGFHHRGIAPLQVMVLKAPTASEARWQGGRRYAPVPGIIGQYASIEAAAAAVPSGYRSSGIMQAAAPLKAGPAQPVQWKSAASSPALSKPALAKSGSQKSGLQKSGPAALSGAAGKVQPKAVPRPARQP